MAQARKILLADADLGSIRALTRTLRTKGYQVQHASDGSKALNVAVLRHPDVILFDEQCPLIDAKAFVQILESNPRTDDIPVVVTTTGSPDAHALRHFREGVLKKPFHVDEVTARIDHLCRRIEAARELKGDARQIEGALTQLPLGDLLQILALNRRTGKLAIGSAHERGEIHLANGRPVNARLGQVEGEKALFRLVSWKDGTFAFTPGPAPHRAVIDRSMEDALLEGMRHTDEKRRLMETLPPLTHQLSIEPGASDVVDAHPVTAEVLRVLNQSRRVGEVLDLVPAPDLEVLTAMSTLLSKGVVRRHEGAPVPDGPVLAPAEVHALRARLLRGRPPRPSLEAKVVVCGTGPVAGRWLLKALPGLTPIAADPPCLRSSFGSLGRLDVSEALKLDFVLVPALEAARPLWRPFATGAIGALVLESTDAVYNLARFCGFELRLPLVIAAQGASGGAITSDALPPSLRGAPAGAAVVSTDVSAALRALLLAGFRAPQSDAPDSMMARRT